MPPLVRFVLRRLASIPLTLLIVTAVLYGLLLLSPVEARASLYLPERMGPHVTEEDVQRMVEGIIEERGLDDPFPVQYVRWIASLLRGDWGYSPVLSAEILPSLLARTPATAELALYASIFFIPLGLVSGLLAASRRDRPLDSGFRFLAFIGTSVPPFILGLLLISIFYVAVRWFPPERLSLSQSQEVASQAWRTYTGLFTIDGLLNRRPDITADALRHLVLPVLTLSLSHWATLGRLTRASVLEELEKTYVVSARARGIGNREVVWRHAFRNALVPALNSTALSAASLVTGVYVVEAVFSYNGVSDLITQALAGPPDIQLAAGFAVFSVLLVLPLMFLLDVVTAALDPRTREGIAAE